jgi:hypothetical protein
MPNFNEVESRGRVRHGNEKAHRPDLRQALRPQDHSQRGQGAPGRVPAVAHARGEDRHEPFRVDSPGGAGQGASRKVAGSVDLYADSLTRIAASVMVSV